MIIDIKELSGILNLASVSSSFEKDYSPIKLISLNEDENSDSDSVIVKSLSSEKSSFLKINISKASGKNLAQIIRGDDLELNPNIYKTVCNIFNFSGVEPAVGYGEKFNERSEDIASSILIYQNNSFLSVEIPFGDLICLSLIGGFQIYIRNVIFEKHGQEFENIKAKR